MAYYNHIAKRWHESTGHKGGSFKRHVLNDLLLQNMAAIADKAILELGAGNGYFMPLALSYSSGQIPGRLVVTDNSTKLLAIAKSQCYIPGAEYMELDVRDDYPFEDVSFDLILATMIFNEVSSGGVRRALGECYRVLQPDGLLLITVTHPEFIASLDRRNLLKKNRDGLLTMPGSGQLRLPIVPRTVEAYGRILGKTGFSWKATVALATDKVIREKPGLRSMKNKPLALVFKCRKSWEN